jgi:hypothetical protein
MSPWFVSAPRLIEQHRPSKIELSSASGAGPPLAVIEGWRSGLAEAGLGVRACGQASEADGLHERSSPARQACGVRVPSRNACSCLPCRCVPARESADLATSVCFGGLTFEVRRPQQGGALARRWRMYSVPSAGPRRHPVGGRLDRRVRPRWREMCAHVHTCRGSLVYRPDALRSFPHRRCISLSCHSMKDG